MEEIEKKSKQDGDSFDGEAVEIVGQYTSGKAEGDRVLEAKRYEGGTEIHIGIRDSRAKKAKASVKLIPMEVKNLEDALYALRMEAENAKEE